MNPNPFRRLATGSAVPVFAPQPGDLALIRGSRILAAAQAQVGRGDRFSHCAVNVSGRVWCHAMPKGGVQLIGGTDLLLGRVRARRRGLARGMDVPASQRLRRRIVQGLHDLLQAGGGQAARRARTARSAIMDRCRVLLLWPALQLFLPKAQGRRQAHEVLLGTGVGDLHPRREAHRSEAWALPMRAWRSSGSGR